MNMSGWQVPQAEQIFLGSVMYQPSRLIEATVSGGHFLVETHRQIYQEILNMDEAGETIDCLSVGEQIFKRYGNNIRGDLAQWVEDAFTETYFYSSQKLILEEHRRREIIKITHNLNEDQDVDVAMQALMNLTETRQTVLYSISEALKAGIDRVKLAEEKGGTVGLPTGLTRLDQSIAGLQDPDLYVIGARPSMGKTALLINMLLANDCAAGFISTEQPKEQIGLRTLSIHGGVSSRRLRSAKLDDDDWPKITNTVSQLSDRQIFIYDKSSVSIAEVMREARKMKYKHDIKILYVDYLQRITSPKAESTRMEVVQVARGLKTLAKDLKIPVVALAQVVREVDKRSDKRPRMGDLQESGAIEQEADTIMLLYRDEIYHPDTQDKGIMEILIDKNRHGPTGRIKVAWIGDQMKVRDLIHEAGNF